MTKQLTQLLPSTIEGWRRVESSFKELPASELKPVYRDLCRVSLYFLIRYALKRPDIEHPWLLARCDEVQASPNGHLDLWAREHYKSSIITWAKTIQDILASHGDDPLPEWGGREATIGIFSHNRPIAKGFLRQIKRELEENTELTGMFPDVLHENPKRDAPSWSEDSGLIVKRKSNPKEATVEAWGLVDGQPIGKHWLVRVYDDTVTSESCFTPDMIAKTTQALELSDNLGTEGGYERWTGTRYHYNDSYGQLLARKVLKPRIYPATEDGSVDGTPVLRSKEFLVEKRLKQGPYIFACQQLLNPMADQTQGFQPGWIKHWDTKPISNINIYITVDPANEKKRTSDYTAVFVTALGEDRHYYVLDMFRDRLSLTERGDLVFKLCRQYKPIAVGYEKYGMQADIDYLKDRMSRENYRFALKALGGQLGKADRIRRLVPAHEQGRWLYPKELWHDTYENKKVDVMHSFIHDEYTAFPVGVHDDMLDAQSRIMDPEMGTVWPSESAKRTITYSSKGIV